MNNRSDQTALAGFLLSGPCEMHRFTKLEYPAAYFCPQCRTGNQTGDCEREKLKEKSNG